MLSRRSKNLPVESTARTTRLAPITISQLHKSSFFNRNICSAKNQSFGASMRHFGLHQAEFKLPRFLPPTQIIKISDHAFFIPVVLATFSSTHAPA